MDRHLSGHGTVNGNFPDAAIGIPRQNLSARGIAVLFI